MKLTSNSIKLTLLTKRKIVSTLPNAIFRESYLITTNIKSTKTKIITTT